MEERMVVLDELHAANRHQDMLSQAEPLWINLESFEHVNLEGVPNFYFCFSNILFILGLEVVTCTSSGWNVVKRILAQNDDIWVFPKIGVPASKWMVYNLMENPIKMDDLGVPLFLETPIWTN